MCTVTIIPKGKSDFVLTSNRDEAPSRISLAPNFYSIKHTKMLFPKDQVAGGSWIGASEKNRVLCVLNGGFDTHERQAEYRLSRGVVVRDLLACQNIIAEIEAYDLHDVEPFTLVIADWNDHLKFLELVWDGIAKYFTDLPLEPQIWSSSTLYTKTMKEERKKWFDDFKEQTPLNATKLLYFHETTEIENTDYGVIMDRGYVKTTSITQVEKINDEVVMRFNNFQDNSKQALLFKLPLKING